MLSCSRCTLLVLAFLVAAFASGCDSDNPSSALDQLEGTYVFTELRFDPDAQAIDDANVLSRLVQANTDVEIFGSGRALIRFKLEGEPSDLADANVSATTTSARFTAQTEEDELRLSDLLMPGSFLLNYSQDGLTLSGSVTNVVNLQAYDPDQYQSLTAVSGRLHVGLERLVEE